MKLKLLRYSDNGNSTLGLLFINDKFSGYILEDEYRKIKVKGEARIPAGTYKLGLRKVESEMTKRYRRQFGWFVWHIQILNVPDFNFVYLHKGNKESHTDGCLLIANTANNNQIEPGFVGDSSKAFERIYKQIYPLLKNGKQVTIQIIDE